MSKAETVAQSLLRHEHDQAERERLKEAHDMEREGAARTLEHWTKKLGSRDAARAYMRSKGMNPDVV